MKLNQKIVLSILQPTNEKHSYTIKESLNLNCPKCLQDIQKPPGWTISGISIRSGIASLSCHSCDFEIKFLTSIHFPKNQICITIPKLEKRPLMVCTY